MSGHNKWSKIKNKKAVEDAKKSKIFSMHVRTITMESKKVKGDKNAASLRAAIDRAKTANVPNDVLDRAVAKGAGGGGESFEEVLYEAYGPGGVAMVIEGITDNKNRTTPEIKHLLTNHGGTLGGQGSAAWAFQKVDGAYAPTALIPLSDDDKEKVASLIDALEENDDIKNVITNAEFE